MQITENTDWGLRVAVIELRRDEGAPTFTLYPMIHLGERQFYEHVLEEVHQHDLLICERAGGRVGRWLTQAYRQAARNRNFGLVLQNTVLNSGQISIAMRIADLPPAEIDRLWRKVPFPSRWAWQLGSLAFGLLWRYFGSRYAMRKLTSTEGRQTDERGPRDLDEVQRAREAVLLAALDAVISEGARRVAVVYGAGHMPVVIKHLMDGCGYTIAGKAHWLTVVAY